MKLCFILTLCVFAYAASINTLMESKVDAIAKKITALQTEYAENKDKASKAAQERFQNIMDRYGTRLTLMEKAVKKYHGVETLDDLTDRKKRRD